MTHVVLLLRGAAFLSVGNAQWSIIDMMEFKVPFEETTFLNYSHLSNKREVTLTNFEKLPPPQKKSPLHNIVFS